MGTDGEAVREETFFREVMDPYVTGLLNADDPWDAYQSLVDMRSAMADYLVWGPHGGAVFIAWADLEDLYETGKTPIPDAHAALRQAAVDWLARPSVPNMVEYVEKWIAEAGQISIALIERDGGFWTSPS